MRSLLLNKASGGRWRWVKAGWVTAGAVVLAGALLPVVLEAAQLHLDAPEYAVSPGGSVTVHLHLDMNELMPGSQAPTNGLYSFGAKLLFDPDALSVSNTNDIALPPALDGDGIFGPAQRAVGEGYAGAAGAVEFGASHGYAGTEVMSVTLNVLTSGVHTVRIELFHGAPMANFVDYAGVNLDPHITTFVRSYVSSDVEEPTIEDIEITSSNTVRIAVTNPDYPPGALSLEGRSCGISAPWLVEGSASLQDLGSGQYLFECAYPGEDCHHYRIGVTP